MNRFVIVRKDSALPCSQSTLARIVPYFNLAAANTELFQQILSGASVMRRCARYTQGV